MRYIIPCYYCREPVLVDQPDNSNIPIEIAKCLRCRKLERANQVQALIKIWRDRIAWQQENEIGFYDITTIRRLT